MTEERIGGVFWMVVAIMGVVILLGATWCILFSFVPDPNPEKTTNLTIEHLWEEDGEYYFADSEGVVYKIGEPHQVMYETMPKTRFAKLKERGQYQVEYRCDWDVRISISEKETER